MDKGLIALCIVAAVQVCLAREVPVPVLRQPYGAGVNTHIIGGRTATRGQFPYVAVVTMEERAFCGGALISKIWVLTTGYCVSFDDFTVDLGAHDIRDGNELGRITYSTNEAVRHKDYNEEFRNNDVGLIKLPEETLLSDIINIIALPPLSWKNKNFTGEEVRVSGWGKTSDETKATSSLLQFVDLEFISHEECKAYFGGIVWNNKYCTNGAGRENACHGDEGGPMTIGSGENLTHLGIVNYMTKNCYGDGYPTIYMATPHFVDWISNKTGIPLRNV